MLTLCAVAALTVLSATPAGAGRTRPQLVLQAGHQEEIDELAFSPDGRLLATCDGEGSTKIWDVASGVLRRSLVGAPVSCGLTWRADGSMVTVWHELGSELYDVRSGTLRATIVELRLTPDGKTAVGMTLKDQGEYDDRRFTITSTDLATGKVRSTKQFSDTPYFELSPTGEVLIGWAYDDYREVTLYNPKTLAVLRTLRSDGQPELPGRDLP